MGGEHAACAAKHVKLASLGIDLEHVWFRDISAREQAVKRLYRNGLKALNVQVVHGFGPHRDAVVTAGAIEGERQFAFLGTQRSANRLDAVKSISLDVPLKHLVSGCRGLERIHSCGMCRCDQRVVAAVGADVEDHGWGLDLKCLPKPVLDVLLVIRPVLKRPRPIPRQLHEAPLDPKSTATAE